jgi:phospholipid/cholesterol/gamma-HCH transport system substrate-binding protein
MIQKRVKVQLAVFLLISILGITYTGAKYVGISRPGATYTIYVDLAESGGIFTNAEVLERGVLVGRVGELKLTADGVRVALTIDSAWKNKIPKDSDAIVANLSAVGEQYVDIRPTTASGPMMQAGDVIPVNRTKVPVETSKILLDLDRFIRSVDREQLSTVLDELGQAFEGTGPDLRRLIQEGDKLTLAATSALPATKALIRDGQTVLATQKAVGGDLRTFSANLALLAQQLVDSDADLRKVFDNGVASAHELDALLKANEATLPTLLGNLVTLGEIQAARVPGLRTILVAYPPNVANGFFTAAGGLAHFGLVYESEPPVCNQGYESTQRRSNSPPDWNKKANLNTYCNEPPTTTNARGARQAPRPPGDDTAGPPPGGYKQLPGTAAATSSTGPQVGTYDPATGLLSVPGGLSFLMGDTGGQQTYFGDQSWKWLLLAPALG